MVQVYCLLSTSSVLYFVTIHSLSPLIHLMGTSESQSPLLLLLAAENQSIGLLAPAFSLYFVLYCQLTPCRAASGSAMDNKQRNDIPNSEPFGLRTAAVGPSERASPSSAADARTGESVASHASLQQATTHTLTSQFREGVPLRLAPSSSMSREPACAPPGPPPLPSLSSSSSQYLIDRASSHVQL